MATTTGTPYLRVFAICFWRLHTPFCTKSKFSALYISGIGLPGVTAGPISDLTFSEYNMEYVIVRFLPCHKKRKVRLIPPPCIFRARTVVVNTTALGTSPDTRHLILKNFSKPI